jgi:hypothetical protein
MSSSRRNTGPGAATLSTSSSFVLAPTPPRTTSDPDDDSPSLPHSPSAAAGRSARRPHTIFVDDDDDDDDDDDEDDDDEDEEDEAQREWRESLQQLELLLTMVLVPYMGKYFGRKAAYWGAIPPSVWVFSTSLAKEGLADAGVCRLGQVHDVEVPRRRRRSGSSGVQGRRRGWGRRGAVVDGTSNDGLELFERT